MSGANQTEVMARVTRVEMKSDANEKQISEIKAWLIRLENRLYLFMGIATLLGTALGQVVAGWLK